MKRKNYAIITMTALIVLLWTILFNPCIVQAESLPEVIISEGEIETLTCEPADNDSRYEQYVNNLFYESGSDTSSGIKFKIQQSTGNRLTGQNAAVYQKLKAAAADIAAGRRDSARISISLKDLGIIHKNFYAADLGLEYIYDNSKGGWNPGTEEAVAALFTYDVEAVMNCLIADCPRELYWQSGSWSYPERANYTAYSSGYVVFTASDITFSLSVESKYRKANGDVYSVDTEKTGAAINAVNNAKNIINAAAVKSDYEKICYYKDRICALVTYNDEAAANINNSSYTDKGAWSLVYVFDNDPNTNVVCEGYSEAFQYLCDQTEFSNSSICAYSVTGIMNGGSGAGNHKWNIIHMNDDKNYLADITNSDEGTIGSNGALFLKGVTSTSGGYRATIFNNIVYYQYDKKTKGIYTEEELTVSENNYIYETSHSYGGWKIIKNATCQQSGERKQVCSHCGDVKIEKIPQIDHSWSDKYTIDVNPTCSSKGSKSTHCIVCGKANENNTIIIPVTEHDWSAEFTVDVNPTSSSEGSKSIHCRRCNAIKPGSKVSIEKLSNENKNIQTGPKVQTVTVKNKRFTIKTAKLKKKAQTISSSKIKKGNHAATKISYKLKKVNKKKFKKYFKLYSNGKLAVKKKLSKGTYKLYVTASAKADTYYKASSKIFIITVCVK